MNVLRMRCLYATNHFFLDLPQKVAGVIIRVSLFAPECREEQLRAAVSQPDSELDQTLSLVRLTGTSLGPWNDRNRSEADSDVLVLQMSVNECETKYCELMQTMVQYSTRVR